MTTKMNVSFNSRKSGKHLEFFCTAIIYLLFLNIKIHLGSQSRAAYTITFSPTSTALKLVQNNIS